MAIDLTIGLSDRPGSLATASDALGRAGVNIDGATGFVCDGQGIFHILVEDLERARRALIDSGFTIEDERRVAVTRVENRPGAAADLLRRIAAAEINIDLLYLAADGRLVLGGPDVTGIQRAIGD